MINPEVKGTLAKLLATENLTVEHRKVTTAYFDVQKRVLCLPIWKTASNTVYDLLVGHEVGHALYTPNKGLDGVNKGFVNVLEDVRIEKMMKETYPGLRKSFFQGYKELWNDDFFGVNNEDISKLPFIDRINLFYKGNPEIQFTEEEQVYVDRAANTKTFEDVLKLAEDLFGRAEDIEDKKMDIDVPAAEPTPGAGDGEGEVTPQASDSETESTDDGESEQQTASQPAPPVDGDAIGNPDAEISVTGGNNSFGDEDYDETESITQEAFNQALETLIDDNAKEWVYLTLPKVNLEEIVIGHKEIQDDLHKHFITGERNMPSHYYYEDDAEKYAKYLEAQVSMMKTRYESYKKDAQKSVNYLVKQFEMKKSADDYKRQSTSRTGVIDTNSLYKYKLTDDIFKKITVVPDGKNHGLVMHIDWSGSMSHILLDTLKQTYNLIWFCRKAGIPFRVLAFQDSYSSAREENRGKEGDLNIHESFKLLEFFSSKQNKQSLDKSMFLVWSQAFSMNGCNVQAAHKYGLGGTPLAEAVLCTRQIVDQMKKEENIQKVNVVCLTDGEANPMAFNEWYDPDCEYYKPYMKRSSLCHQSGKIFFLRDPKTGFTKKISSSPYETTKQIVGFHREITDYNWIGIRICSKSELGRAVRNNMDIVPADMDRKWKKEKFFSISKEAGFSESFYIPDKRLGDGTEDLQVSQKGEVATKAELQRAFKKHMGSKMGNKTILNKFIEQIA
ncbi:MAG: hypothetical protein CM15mV36_0840 [Caudoviricetes sp.]|nr:MAG: hypothetical protein CM15mV36_0840 [Caudoviricetes sp.]